jgi:ABC-2 type transport system permease protein
MTTTTALDARWAAVLAGLSRGWIETRHSFTETATLMTQWFAPVTYAVLLLVLGRITPPGTHFSAASGALPVFLCMIIIMGGLGGPTGGITADRENGTLLRAKATPNGMLGYLVGKIVMCALTTLLSCVVILVPGIMIASDLILDARTWLLLTLVFVVGMVSTVPIGVALGSIMKSSSQVPLVVCGSMLITVVSIFPITLLPTWLKLLVQAFPAYWVALGARSAMLPAEMVAAEIGKWRAVEMFAVPGVWAAIGLSLAPILLRRMARRQSGYALGKVLARKMLKGY